MSLLKPTVLNRKNLLPEDRGVYVGRPTRFGNIFPVGKSYDRLQAVEAFKAYLFGNPELMQTVRRQLKGKNLICFCAPLACHADVLLDVANDETGKYEEFMK